MASVNYAARNPGANNATTKSTTFKRDADRLKKNYEHKSRSVAQRKSTQNWYKGSQPTARETIAATYKASEMYPQKRKELFSSLEREMATPGSYMYMPYKQATATKQTQTNINNTNKALAEWDNLQNELSFWATSSRNYSDDEIIGRIDWGKYPTLSKMDAGFEGGEPLALLAPVGYSKDAMYGMLWAARNPTMSSGDPFLDSVQSAYGKGKAYVRDSKKAAWLDPTNPDYNPYAVGSTMDDMMLKYRTETFDDKWLAEHRDLLLDPDTAKDYTKIWHANEKTKKLQAEAADWDAYVQAAMRLDADPSDIFTEDALEEYSGLYDLYLSLESGGKIDTTAAINFDWASQKKAAEAEYMRVHGTVSTPEYETQLNNGTGGSHVQNQTDSELEKRWLLNTGIIGKYPMTPGEERSFRALAYSGYNDVVFTAADGVANGTGGKERMDLALAGEANALASKYWFNAMNTISGVENKHLSDYMSIEAYDRLKALFPNMESELPAEDEFLSKWKNASAVYEPDQLMSEFDMKGEDNVTLDSVKGTKLGAFMATYAPGKETFTREDVQDAFGQYAQQASAPVPWEMLGEELNNARVAKEQDAADLEAAKAQLAEIEDAVAEAWGEDTEQYRAFFATYEYAQQEENSRWNNYTDYDQYQRYTMQEGYDPAKGTEYLVAARGSAAQDVKRARAALENAQKLGFDQKMVEKLELHLREKENRLSLLNAHYLSANEDYAAKVAAFDKAYTPENIDWFDGNDVLNAITDLDEALNIAYGSAGGDYRLSGLRDAVYLVSAMTDEEKNNYKYKYAEEGAESAGAYYGALSEILTVRKSKQISEATQEWAGENAATGAIATAGSIAMTPLEALEGVTNTIRALFGEELNPYKDYSVSRTKSDLRTGVKDSIKEFVEDPMLEAALVALFEAGTSAGDSLVSSVTGGAAAMAFSAMNSSMMEASMRGASREQALWYGFWNAAIEMGTEKLGMERISKAFQKKGAGGIRELIGEMSSGFINELGEETAGGFAQKVTDDIIMGALSNYNALVAEYESIGLTRAEAEAQAAKDTLVDIGYQGVIGGLSGSLSSAGGFVVGAVLGKKNSAEDAEKPVEAPVEPASPVYRGTEKERAVTALATAQSEGVGEAQQQATVQGVLEGLGVSAQESSAAAKAIMDSAGTKIASLLIAKSDNASEMAMAITMAEVNPQSKSHAVMMQKVDSRNARALGKQLVEAYHADIENRQTVAQYEAAVAESATNDATIEAEKATDMGEIEKARQAKQLLGKETRAKWNAFAKAQKEVESASAALKEASAAVAQSPTKEAIDMQRLANKELQKVRSERDSAKAAFEEASARHKEAAATEQKLVQNVQSTARAQAKQQVIVETEQRRVAEAEKAVKAEQERAAADVKRQVDNVAALEANSFIEETYADATSKDREALRNAYVAAASEDGSTAANETTVESPKAISPIDKKSVEFTTQLSKLFNVKFNFVENDSDFEGKYRDGVITINKKSTQGEAIKKVALHELVHHVEKTGEYKALVNMVKEYFFKDDAEAYDREVEGLRQLYESKKDSLGIAEEIDYTYGERELVAEYAARIFEADEQFVERIVAEKPSLAVRIAESLKNIVDKLRGVNDPELDMIRKAEKAFRKALEKSADPRTRSLRQSAAESAHPNTEQFSISQFARAAGLQMRTNSDGDPYTIVDADGNEVKNVTSDMIKTSPMGKLIATAQNSGTIDADTAQKQYDMFAELMTMVAEYKDQAMIWEIAGSELFSAIKSNSDTQYSTTVDFGTICSKTREVVNVMSETMLKKGRGLTREEVIDAYNNTHKSGMAVPCPVCYVFSRWMGVPSLLETMRKGQERFANATDADVNAYLKSVSEKYGIKGKDLSESVGKAKTKVQNKLKKISESLLKDVFKNNADKTALIEQAKALEAELDEIEMFNWVNQVLCKTDRKRKPILDKDGNVTIDPNYKAVPNEVLLDLRRTGEFASDYAKAWTFRTTRGAGMGKAILPYSGAELGDTISGVKRWAASQNPYFTGDDKAAARKMKFAQIRAKVQNLIGGQRFQSTSDYRPEWGLDYLSTFLEMQAIGAKGQLYTKVIEAVDMFATAGIEVNMSIMPKNNGYHLDENGNPVLGEEDFSDVTGISFKGALEKTQKYDNAQMILVGINDTHIELAMADDRITFIIPWHSSGNSKDTLTTLMNAVGESLTNAEDYTDIQTDKPSENQTPEQKAMWDLRMEILTGKLKRGVSDEQQKLLDSNPYLKTLYEKFYVDESATDTYGVKLSKAQAGQIFPHEYWDTSLTIDQADENGRRFVEYCATMGIEPRFGKFSDKPGYWKLLIDRRMYNRDGTYHVPQTIDVTKVDIADVAAEVSQAKVGTPEQISEAVQGTIDDINARLPAEQFDMQAEVDIDSDDASGQYSIPSDDVLKRQVRSWRSGRSEELAPAPNGMIPGGSEQEQQPHGDGERQFVVKTLPNNPNIPEWAVEGLLNNPKARYYQKDTNRDQLVRGWQRVQENGVQSEVERLLSLDTFTADDTAESNLLMAMALREDTADPATFFALAEKSAVAGTDTAQALQVRTMISKMTPDGMKIWAAGQLEKGLREHMRTHQPQRQQVDEAAAQVADKIRDLQSGDEVLRLNAGGDFTIDESNNRWGIPINEQQQALIDHYKLNKVARPGIFYNRATMKQRMLEAIIATPNPLEVTGLGLNLVQRLEFMQRNEAVITNADLNYMGTQLGQFVALGGEGGGRAADLALARAYEAFSNITPATRMEKFRTTRYVNMLNTFTSFSRNIIGNMGQNAVNAAAHGIGVEIDRLASLGTGRRTMAHLSTAERIEGWKAFAEETKNTFLDFFVDKANTAPNRDKYNTNQRGRTFQNSGFEIAKDIESFLMSVGDRNVWKKAFVNSMAEQQKLADRNQLFNADGTTRTQEQMVEQAEADANYATFTEESLAQDVMNYLRSRNPVAADVISLYIPFTGVPHNIMKRNFQYSPFGFLTMAGRMAANAVHGKQFDQHAFVNDLSRALTGTGGVLAGVMLGLGGIIKMGTEDEEKDKVYDVETALGEQYTPYVYDPTTDTYVSMSTFAPSASPLVWGASIGQMLQNDEFNASALIGAMTSSVDSIFDASYLSGLSDLFGGYGSFAENLAHVTAENLSSQLTPAFLNQVANAMDPYVRETKDKDYMVELLKTTMNRIPGLRNMLPEKVTVAGENVTTKQGWSLVDPFTRTNPSDNAALLEVKRLYDVTGRTGVLPSDALRGRKNEIKIDKKSVVLNDQQKEEYKKYYGQLWTSAINDLTSNPAYPLMDDDERADHAEDIMNEAQKRAKKEFIKRYGD